jgi:hypothetical protein
MRKLYCIYALLNLTYVYMMCLEAPIECSQEDVVAGDLLELFLWLKTSAVQIHVCGAYVTTPLEDLITDVRDGEQHQT